MKHILLLTLIIISTNLIAQQQESSGFAPLIKALNEMRADDTIVFHYQTYGCFNYIDKGTVHIARLEEGIEISFNRNQNGKSIEVQKKSTVKDLVAQIEQASAKLSSKIYGAGIQCSLETKSGDEAFNTTIRLRHVPDVFAATSAGRWRLTAGRHLRWPSRA